MAKTRRKVSSKTTSQASAAKLSTKTSPRTRSTKNVNGSSSKPSSKNSENKMRNYGYRDPTLVTNVGLSGWKKWFAICLALLFLVGVWFALNQKLLLGDAWISETYDREEWRTNEGNLQTYGAWDLEAHVWKSEYIIENFPNFHWNPYWYLGMPLLKYYQLGFYAIHILVMFLTGFSAPKAALMLIIFAHLFAVFMTFLLCYKVSRRAWVSAFAASFLLSNTFMSLRSYGWEPISVVFMFLFPLGLMLFLRDPLRPLRLSVVLVCGVAYLCHPLIWFSLLMTMGLYLFSIAIRTNPDKKAERRHYIWMYFVVVALSICIGAIQFLPQISYHQVTSGAHMGVTYLPGYHVENNIIGIIDFLFDAGNLKGPGPVVLISMFLVVIFFHKRLLKNELVAGLLFVLFMMVFFYYLERYDIFPMNKIRSVQYHRIIPEFIVVAATLVATLSNHAKSLLQKVTYYSVLIAFVAASMIIVYNVQSQWATIDDISHKEEFIHDAFPGRFSVPYTDQSISVRNSFTRIPQVYGYYEQGITNSYNDEMFSVSSGFHSAELSVLYLQAANVGRLYVNMEEGERDIIVRARLNNTLDFVYDGGRYGYFEIPLADASYAQAVDYSAVQKVEELALPCREMFSDIYCASQHEEFVSKDPQEVAYLSAYVDLLGVPYASSADLTMVNGDTYQIDVSDAETSTAVLVKMTYDDDFHAYVSGPDTPFESAARREVEVVPFGPDFMLIYPGQEGDYTITLEYHVSFVVKLGALISLLSLIMIFVGFALKDALRSWFAYKPLKKGDLGGGKE